VIQPLGGTPVRIGDAICPSPLSDEIRTTTNTEGDTIQCDRPSPRSASMGSSETLNFNFSVNLALPEGAQAHVFGRLVDTTVFEGPLVATLDTNAP
jgi:hypothetical protein